MKKLSWVVFAGIIIFAFILRFWQLGSAPDGFHADEAAYGYNAYSIMKTGRDEYGKQFPLILKSFYDYKGAIYAYLTIPFISVSGLNEWAVRAPSALFGVLFVLLTYALVYRISDSYRLALLSMALAAISPVGILLSRVQSDPLVCVFFLYLGLYVLLTSFKTNNRLLIAAAIISMVISFYTHPVSRLFVVPMLAGVGVSYWPVLQKKARGSFLTVTLCMAAAVGLLLVSTAGARFAQVSIFSKMDVQLPLEEQIREDGSMRFPLLFTRMVHNKVMAYGQYFLDNFASYMSYDFLFRRAAQPSREGIPNSGILLLIELPFLLMGVYASFRKRLSYGIRAVLWFLLVPLVLSFASDESPNIHRFFLATIPVHILTALGIVAALDHLRGEYRKLAAVIITAVFLANLGYYLHQLFVHQPIHNPYTRNNVDKELALTLKELTPSYDVIVTQKILEHMLFFWPIDPAAYQKGGSPRDTDNARYGKFLFVTDACPSNQSNPAVAKLTEKRILYVDLAQCKEMLPVVKRLYYRNTLEAYRLVERQ